MVKIEVSRGEQRWLIAPEQSESFPFQHGDRLAVISPADWTALPVAWGDMNVPISPGHSIRVPATYESAKFKWFRIPYNLTTITGAGPETLESFGLAHAEKYQKYLALSADMTIIVVGCGIGRDAFQLVA